MTLRGLKIHTDLSVARGDVDASRTARRFSSGVRCGRRFHHGAQTPRMPIPATVRSACAKP